MSNENPGDPSQPPDLPADAPAAAAPAQSYTFGPVRIDVDARHLLRDEAVIPLTAKVFDTLLVLVRNHHRAVTKDELMQAVWPGSFVSDDSLVQNISAIRRALGDDPSQPRYIATLARRGYRFIAPTTEHTGTDAPSAVSASPAAEAAHTAPAPPAAAPAPQPSRLLWRVAAAFAAGLALAALAFQAWSPAGASDASGGSIRFRESPPPGYVLRGGGVLSPDSRYLAFVGRDPSGAAQLWIRELGAGAARPVSGTEGVVRPFWSPDSQFVGFFAGGQVKRVGVTDGSPRLVAATQRFGPLGGTWSTEDLLLYADQGKLYSVSASGGTPEIVLEPDRNAQQGELRWPQFLPDGSRFLFFVSSENPEQAGTYLGTLGSRDTKRLLDASTSPAIYAPPGYLLYVRERVLLAQRFDLLRGELTGNPMTVAGEVAENATLSATAGGLLSISEETAGGRLVWFDRKGGELGTVSMPKMFSNMALSPNNLQLLGSSNDGGNWAMWLVDLDRNVSTQIGVNGAFPAWAPDGVRFAFSSMRAGEADVFVRSIMGAGEEEGWLKTDEVKSVDDWSSDGRFIVFTNYKQRDLWLLPTFGDRKPVPIVQTQGFARNGRVSPDGRSLAYTSDETGTTEIYVQSFPVPGAKRRVSTSGGTQPAWRQDGRELFYRATDDKVMAVPIQSSPDGLEPGKPQPLFPVTNATGPFAITRDGQRFLVVTRNPASDQGSITVLTNWEAAQRP